VSRRSHAAIGSLKDVTVFLSAGELSGDAYGGRLALALRRRLPRVALLGVGGPGMAAAGVELMAGLNDLAVMGFAEVV
jgi:lipid-A-disaccharide synthase